MHGVPTFFLQADVVIMCFAWAFLVGGGLEGPGRLVAARSSSMHDSAGCVMKLAMTRTKHSGDLAAVWYSFNTQTKLSGLLEPKQVSV
jgi:hypothetical protein